MQKVETPDNISYIRNVEQRVIDLLTDNDCNKIPSSHRNLDENLRFEIFNKWSYIHNEIDASHLNRPPEILQLEVVANLRRIGYIDVQKTNTILVLAGLISADCLMIP